MRATWDTPADLHAWSLAELLSTRSVLWMMNRYNEAAALTAELRRRGFTA